MCWGGAAVGLVGVCVCEVCVYDVYVVERCFLDS